MAHFSIAVRGKWRHVLSDDRQSLIERLDMHVCEILTDEFESVLVEQRRLHGNAKLAIDQWRDLDMDELKGIGGRRISAGWYVKGHCSISVLLRRAPRYSGSGV
jgi:hypothetical protein